MFNNILSLIPKRIKLRKIKEQSPVFFSNKKLKKILLKKKQCPDCGNNIFNEGPTINLTYSIVCQNCRSWFMINNSFGVQRIHKEFNYNWYENFDIYKENYYNCIPYTREIIKNWYKIIINHSISISSLKKQLEWCSNIKNIKGKWSVKDFIFYFEDDNDAIAFKLKWL